MAIEVDLTTTDGEGVLDVEHPEYIEDLTPRGFTRGLAQAEDAGLVLKNPEPVKGQVYLMWNEADGEHAVVYVVTYNGTLSDETRTVHLFDPLAHITRPSSDDAPLNLQHTSTMYIPTESRAWVKARLAPPSPTDEQLNVSIDTARMLQGELFQQRDAFANFSDALNEMAEDNGWCSTYDAIVQELGMPGRQKDWWVEVQADVTIEDNSPTTHMDSRLGAEYGIPIEATYIEVHGKVTIKVTGITAGSAELAQQDITEEQVQAELDDQFSGQTISITDWEITDSGQEED